MRTWDGGSRKSFLSGSGYEAPASIEPEDLLSVDTTSKKRVVFLQSAKTSGL